MISKFMCIEICNLKRNLSYSAVSQCGTLPDWLVITIKHHLSIRANHAFFPLYPFIFFTANRLYVFQLSSFMILTESKLYNTGMTKKGWLIWNTKQNLHLRINFFFEEWNKKQEGVSSTTFFTLDSNFLNFEMTILNS